MRLQIIDIAAILLASSHQEESRLIGLFLPSTPTQLFPVRVGTLITAAGYEKGTSAATPICWAPDEQHRPITGSNLPCLPCHSSPIQVEEAGCCRLRPTEMHPWWSKLQDPAGSWFKQLPSRNCFPNSPITARPGWQRSPRDLQTFRPHMNIPSLRMHEQQSCTSMRVQLDTNCGTSHLLS